MFSLLTGQHNKKIVLKTRVGCCLLVAPVVSRRTWEAGEEHKERRTDGRKVLGQVVTEVVGGWGAGCSHAVTKAGLWRLGVTWCSCVAVAVGLLGRHGHVGPCCEHELGCACKQKHQNQLWSLSKIFLRLHLDILVRTAAQQRHIMICFTVNNGLRLCSLLLLFPQRLGGFEFVHLRKTQQQ